MTRKLAPGSPKLELDGEPQEGDVISDSYVPALEDPKEQTKDNLGRIARERKQSGRTPRAKG